jgi:5-methylcytosine-specific restriction endonuclease McrA
MGLPQYLRRKHKAMWRNEEGIDTDLLLAFFYAGRIGIRLRDGTPFRDISRRGSKLLHGDSRSGRKGAQDSNPYMLELVDTTRFVAIWKDEDGTYKWEGAPTKVQRRYLSKYEKLRAVRIERVLKREKRLAIQNRVYESRAFPPTVAALIWERDDYTCKICGRELEELIRIGRWLTADHVKEWEDGGLTTMGNGQTLCNICNSAKHHAKKYFALGNDLRTA